MVGAMVTLNVLAIPAGLIPTVILLNPIRAVAVAVPISIAKAMSAYAMTTIMVPNA